MVDVFSFFSCFLSGIQHSAPHRRIDKTHALYIFRLVVRLKFLSRKTDFRIVHPQVQSELCTPLSICVGASHIHKNKKLKNLKHTHAKERASEVHIQKNKKKNYRYMYTLTLLSPVVNVGSCQRQLAKS